MTLGFRERNDENMEEFLSSLSKANELNENLFKLDKKQVAEIVLSSMFGRR